MQEGYHGGRKKPESGGLSTTMPVTLVLAILAGLVFTHTLPYQDERPSIRPLQTHYAATQDLDARLLQDPLRQLMEQA